MALPTKKPPSAFLRGNWWPVEDEIECSENTITGQLPSDLRGSFLRIGPNPRNPELLDAGYHFFAGAGMIHGVELRDGRACYRRKFVRTPMFMTGEDVAGEDGEERGGFANTGTIAVLWCMLTQMAFGSDGVSRGTAASPRGGFQTLRSVTALAGHCGPSHLRQ